MFTFFCRDRFHYFKAEDDRWKNSVRHNLSMNPHFRKGGKAKQGSGHLWVLADYDKEEQLSQIHVQPTQHHDQPSVPQNGNQLGSNISVNPAVDVNEKVCPNSGSSLEEYGQQNRTLQVSYAFKFIYFEKDIESKPLAFP